MKQSIVGVASIALMLSGLMLATADASSERNGACVGMAGSTGGQKFSGVKCYLDRAPGNWVIRYTVMERDNADEYKKLLRLPKRPVRCTLTVKSTTMEVTNYAISNC